MNKDINKEFPFADTELFRFLQSKNFESSGRHSKNRLTLLIPRVFSFISNPRETIRTIRKTYRLSFLNIDTLILDFSQTDSIDICAWSVLIVFLTNYEKSRQNNNQNTEYKILLGTNPAIHDFIRSSELIENELSINSILSDKKNTYLFLIGGGSNLEVDFKCTRLSSGEAATTIFNYIDDNIHDFGFNLTIKGKRHIAHIVGEIIDNCEIHSGDFCQWFAKAYFHKETNRTDGSLYLTIFNFGNTIYENMKNCRSQLVEKFITNKINVHKHRGNFRANKWQTKTITTFLALQDGISSLKDEINELDRGIGTIQYLDCFHKLADNDQYITPEMCIFSGHSHIRIDKNFPLIHKSNPDITIFSLNKSGKLSDAPDYNYVNQFEGGDFFPGTLISLRIKLKDEFKIPLK